YSINPVTGALTGIAGAPFAAGDQPTDVAMGVKPLSSATLVSLQVIPANPAFASASLGQTQQFSAIGTYSDGSTQFLTSSATWSSSSTGVATISNTAGRNG